MSTKKPRWRTVDDIPGYVGDRIVAISQWSEKRGRPSCQHVVVLIVREEGPATDDEGLGLSIHDCDYWMPEAEFLKLFGPEVQSDTPPDATPWQQADGWEGRQ